MRSGSRSILQNERSQLKAAQKANMSMADLNEKTTRLQLDLKQENAEHGALEAKLDETNA